MRPAPFFSPLAISGLTAILSLALLPACSEKAGSTCEDPGAGISATVDGAPWSAAGVSWLASGESVQVLTTEEGAGRMTVVAQLTTDGAGVAEALEAGTFPIEVTLKTGTEGGFVTWYTPESDSMATTEGGEGTLTLAGLEEGRLWGCLSFTAGPDGAGVTVEDGSFSAEESELGG